MGPAVEILVRRRHGRQPCASLEWITTWISHARDAREPRAFATAAWLRCSIPAARSPAPRADARRATTGRACRKPSSCSASISTAPASRAELSSARGAFTESLVVRGVERGALADDVRQLLLLLAVLLLGLDEGGRRRRD